MKPTPETIALTVLILVAIFIVFQLQTALTMLDRMAGDRITQKP